MGFERGDLRVVNGFQVARDLRLNLGVDLREQVWARFDAFNNVAPGGTASLRYRFGLGRLAPWVLIEDHLAYAFFMESNKSDEADGFRIRGGFGITERLSLNFFTRSALQGTKSLLGPERKQRHALATTFDVTSSLQVAFGYLYRNGEVISYAIPPRPDLVALSSAARTTVSAARPTRPTGCAV